jgi:hypothetical protein
MPTFKVRAGHNGVVYGSRNGGGSKSGGRLNNGAGRARFRRNDDKTECGGGAGRGSECQGRREDRGGRSGSGGSRPGGGEVIRGDGRIIVDAELGFHKLQQARVLNQLPGFLRIVVPGELDEDSARKRDLHVGFADAQGVYAVFDDIRGDFHGLGGDGLIRRKIGLKQDLLSALQIQSLAYAGFLAEHHDVLGNIYDQNRDDHDADGHPGDEPTHPYYLQTAKYLPGQDCLFPRQAEVGIISLAERFHAVQPGGLQSG